LGPAWKKVGGRVLYALPDLRRFASGEEHERAACLRTSSRPKTATAQGEEVERVTGKRRGRVTSPRGVVRVEC
jgi:hypothetical protein